MQHDHAAPYWWVVPLIGVFAATIAFWSVITNRRIARAKATLDMIEKIESTPHYAELRRKFKDNLITNDNTALLMAPRTDDDRKNRVAIIAYLNHNELIAIGCRRGILDAEFYAEWMRTLYVGDWHAAKAFIFLNRHAQPAGSPKVAYVAFEHLARQFEQSGERRSRLARFRGFLHAWYKTARGRDPILD